MNTYIEENILSDLANNISIPEQGVILLGKNNVYDKAIYLKNKAKNKKLNFNIGFRDRFVVAIEMFKTKSYMWGFIHSHNNCPYLSETDLKSAKVGQTWGIIDLKSGTLIFYEIVLVGKRKGYKIKPIFLKKESENV